ncbi:hypothetical protein T03_16708 [Trichinella britovi]|uniref:Uncharacterized protein n=1 Tax=Trichinella britovi TaxID=45882 RepID=A0A0V1CWX6_TRIBR|nr:hypothetical protein T03_16708 [Trichinella britovi]
MKNELFIVFPTKHLLLPNTKTCKLSMVDCFPTKYIGSVKKKGRDSTIWSITITASDNIYPLRKTQNIFKRQLSLAEKEQNSAITMKTKLDFRLDGAKIREMSICHLNFPAWDCCTRIQWCEYLPIRQC